MARPDYIICLECETEVEDFTWREGAIQRANCDVCGNTDPDAFSLPEDFDQEFEVEDDEHAEVEDEEDEDEADFKADLETDEDEER